MRNLVSYFKYTANLNIFGYEISAFINT